MSRELDFIDFINERAEREGYTYTPTEPLTNLDYIQNALKCIDEYPEEKADILKYQEILLRIESEQDTAVIEILQGTKAALEVQLKDVIDSEKKKSYSKDAKVLLETIKRYRQMYDQKCEQERIERKKWQAEAETIEQIPQHQNQESPLPKQDNVHLNEKEQKIMNILTSKRIAAVIAILLCVVLYFSLLTTAFSTKRDTYVCYTTKTGECFHSADCRFLNTAYETTVFEASKKYKVCKYCNPCIDEYKTTYVSRNYIAPLFISIPVSALVFVILTVKKKPQ